ncbi:SprT family zinc-dependent metalloprotease [Sedimentibacter sp.]|uniref:M48 family metallopeptidase n=1 Tax=Sedimentibacter sp. TaxID=1960295 RepID=UPI0028B215EB|nr:SprT family zinc-dependent metalloprotease [Sedimentibacter sp.]
MDKITVENIDIELVKKKIKNIHLSVRPPDGRVSLSVPYRMDEKAIKLFVESKLSWIKKQRKKYSLQEQQVERAYVSGESHYYFGESYLLNVYETTGRQHAELRNNKYIDLYVRPCSTSEKREKIMTEWYRNNLKQIIPEYIEKWEKIIGVTVNEWNIKLMKTRWGTCNVRDKRIWINLELAKKNPRCLEYIVVHEMVHLLERYHNDIFKSYMNKFLPNWKIICDELNGLTFDNS